MHIIKKNLFIALLLVVGMISSSYAQMTLVFDTNLSSGTTITLPLNGTVDVTIDWGDGNTGTATTAGNLNHTYATGGTYTVQITGTLTSFGSNNNPNADKLTTVTSFGNLGLTSLSYAFHNAINLIQVPDNIPSSVTNMMGMFLVRVPLTKILAIGT